VKVPAPGQDLKGQRRGGARCAQVPELLDLGFGASDSASQRVHVRDDPESELALEEPPLPLSPQRDQARELLGRVTADCDDRGCVSSVCSRPWM
jgi:hypothetical protein